MLLLADEAAGEGSIGDMRKRKGEDGNGLKSMRKPVCCPVCGWRIMDASAGIKTQLSIPWKGRYPDFYLKCGHCGAEIGISKTE